MSPRRLNMAALAVVVLVTALVFWNSLSADFVKFDDDVNVYKNPNIEKLSWQSLIWMFTDTQQALRYKPLTWLTWSLIRAASGLAPFAFHLVNFLLHCLDAALVFMVIRKLLWTRGGTNPGTSDRLAATVCAGAGTLLWAVHPLRVEPVAWVTGMPYLQSEASGY
jgi:protein O-mannosyl-transferase